MKKYFINACFILSVLGLIAQEPEEKPKDRPVRSPFETGILIDNQTTVVPPSNSLELLIQHKFGTMANGFSDLFGIYAPGANIRLALSYVPIKNLQVGYGLSRVNMYSDFSVKYTILEQTRRNTIPVAVGIYANMTIDGRNEELFGKNYQFTNRFSYFSQLIAGRKFTDWLSVQANVSFTHFNITQPGIDHDKIALGFNGRIKFSPQSSILFQYDIPLKVDGIREHREFKDLAKPNLGIGWEIKTTTHAFHIYVTSADGMIPQHNALYNNYDWTRGDLMFGFSINRLWGF